MLQQLILSWERAFAGQNRIQARTGQGRLSGKGLCRTKQTTGQNAAFFQGMAFAGRNRSLAKTWTSFGEGLADQGRLPRTGLCRITDNGQNSIPDQNAAIQNLRLLSPLIFLCSTPKVHGGAQPPQTSITAYAYFGSSLSYISASRKSAHH